MDRRTQSFIVFLAIVFLMSVGNCSGQCTDSITVSGDSCERVSMSIGTFEELYQAHENLATLKEAIPEAEVKLDSMMNLQASQNRDFKAKLDAANKKVSLLEADKKDCNQRLINVEIDNMQKSKRIQKLKKKNSMKLGVVGIVGILMGFLLSSISG